MEKVTGMTVQRQTIHLERRVVWCNGHNGGGVGCRPRGENGVREMDVTDIGDGQKVERPRGKNRARRDDMIGETVCL